MPVNLPAIITLPPEASLGPAMRALNEQQRLFVIALYALGNQRSSTPKAYKAAGYGTENEYATAQAAYRLKRDPRVQTAMKEFWDQNVKADLIPGIHRAIKDGLTDLDIEVRLKTVKVAAPMLGLNAPQKVEVTHKGESRADMIKEIMGFSSDPAVLRALIGGASAFVPKVELRSEPIDVAVEEVWDNGV